MGAGSKDWSHSGIFPMTTLENTLFKTKFSSSHNEVKLIDHFSKLASLLSNIRMLVLEKSGEAENKTQWRLFDVRVGENGREAGRGAEVL